MKICKKCNVEKKEEEFNLAGKGRRRKLCKECYSEHRKKSDYRPEARYKKYKRDAKRRGIDFSLTREEFFSFKDKPCRYCGIYFKPICLDRLDNTKGYNVKNVDSCCSTCNSLKHIFTEKDFIGQIKKIYAHQEGINNDK